MWKRFILGITSASLIIISLSSGISDSLAEENITYKCLLQLKNYEGQGAYIVISVLNAEGNYIKTLRVMGDDTEWYADLYYWFPFWRKDKHQIDGMTGATISGGERSVFSFEIEKELFNKGNVLRFETAVEDQKYHAKDVSMTLNTNKLSGSHKGKGYIRYIKILSQ